MGYKTSFSTTQKKCKGSLRRRHNEVSVLITGVQDSWSFPHLEPTVLRFLALKDISDDVKGEFLLLTRYLLDFFRASGFKRTADNFSRKANIDEEQPLDGSFMEYWGMWFQRPATMGYWPFFCQQKLKALKEQTSQGNALNITTKNQQPLSVDQSSSGQSYTGTTRVHVSPRQRDQDSGHAMHSELVTSVNSGMISVLRRFLFSMLRKIIFDYFVRKGYRHVYGGIAKEPETDDEEQLDGSPSGSTSSNSKSIAPRLKKRCISSGEI